MPVRNILFIMCDQLRWDYLSCTGHPRLATPNIDALAARGVLFSRLLPEPDLRFVTNELLHGPLCRFTRRRVE